MLIRIGISKAFINKAMNKKLEANLICNSSQRALLNMANKIIEARVKRQEMGLEDDKEPKEKIDKSIKPKKNRKLEKKERLSEDTNFIEEDIEMKEEILKPEQLLLF